MMASTNKERLHVVDTYINVNKFDMFRGIDPRLEGDKNHRVYYDTRFAYRDINLIPTLPVRTPDKGDFKYANPNFVKLPWSTDNEKHDVIAQALNTLASDGASSIESIQKVMNTYRANDNFGSLQAYHDSLSADDRLKFFEIFRGIANLAYRGKELFSMPIEFLQLDYSEEMTSVSASFTQQQCAVLLAHAFLGTFPERDSMNEKFNTFSMHRLFHKKNDLAQHKLKFIMHYFEKVLVNMPKGIVTFKRARQDKRFQYQLCQRDIAVMATRPGCIEDSQNTLNMDFADSLIGGWVLGPLAAQEEILFLLCPELMVSMLLCPRMEASEAILVAGAQRFNGYSGYEKTLRWAEFEGFGKEKRDEYGRIEREIVCIDALDYSYIGGEELDKKYIDRELHKAYVGFHNTDDNPKPVATGQWGCGEFGGSLELKFFIQLLAASVCNRPLLYFPFGNLEFEKRANHVYSLLKENGITIAQLYTAIIKFKHNNTTSSLFEYIARSLFPF